MSFTIAVYKRFKLIFHLIDVDPTDGNIMVGLEISWK